MEKMERRDKMQQQEMKGSRDSIKFLLQIKFSIKLIKVVTSYN